MPQDQQLTGEQREWLRRVAFSRTPIKSFPPTIEEALVAAGLAEKDLFGPISVNAAGRRYLVDHNLVSTGHQLP